MTDNFNNQYLLQQNMMSCNIKSRHLLILPCSKRKNNIEYAKALDIYDGPFYKIIKKYSRNDLDILIVSAKYGLIKPDEFISYYDQTMTAERAKEIASETRSRLALALSSNEYKNIIINLGAKYICVLDECEDLLEGYNIYLIKGRIGERLHRLKILLHQIESEEAFIND